jgi:hypothetical protein
MWAVYVSFRKLAKANNRPTGETSPILVTLPSTAPACLCFCADRGSLSLSQRSLRMICVSFAFEGNFF